MTDSAALPVGVMLPRDVDAASVVPFAQAADRAGFDELWVVEDLGFRGGIAQAATALAVTERISVGIGILPAAARNPAFAAMELNSLAELFPGRVIAGIGHGTQTWMRQVGEWPASPLTLLRETVGAVRSLLHGERIDVAGRYVSVAGLSLESPAGRPPWVLAGVRGPKSLAAAAQVADGVILAEPVTPEYLAAAQVSMGRIGPGGIVAFAPAAVDADAARARAAVRPGLEMVGDPDWAPHIDPLPWAEDLRTLRRGARDRAEFAARLPDLMVDALAVVGTPERAALRIAELHDAGATSVVLIPVGADPLSALAALAGVIRRS